MNLSLPGLRRRRRWLLEVFLAGNLLFLAVDIYFAHSVNSFREPVEWLPLWFSLAGGLVLFGLLASGRGPDAPATRWAGGVIGALSVGVGIWGTVLHLESAFFRRFALDGLVYAAPFVAPLAYAGIGFLLLVNRAGLFREAPDDLGWGQRVTLFAAAGFGGNFVLSLLDHEQNGFSFWTEWIPVAAAALAVSNLLFLGLKRMPAPGLVRLAVLTLLLQTGVGLLGFWLHLDAGISALGGRPFEAFVHGAPPFAPLLFADLAVLGGIGLLALPASSDAAGQSAAVR